MRAKSRVAPGVSSSCSLPGFGRYACISVLVDTCTVNLFKRRRNLASIRGSRILNRLTDEDEVLMGSWGRFDVRQVTEFGAEVGSKDYVGYPDQRR
jgi:hypothetical protein